MSSNSTNPAKTNQTVTLTYQPQYASKYDLFEIEPHLLDQFL